MMPHIELEQRERSYNRIRVIFYAEPLSSSTSSASSSNTKQNEQEQKQSSDTHSSSSSSSSATPKSIPNYESIGACWVSIDQLNSGHIRLRGQEPLQWFNYVHQRKTIFPLDVLQSWRNEK